MVTFYNTIKRVMEKATEIIFTDMLLFSINWRDEKMSQLTISYIPINKQFLLNRVYHKITIRIDHN
jgi:hypothetical protein